VSSSNFFWTSTGRAADPEMQAYVRLMESDLYLVLEACVAGRLRQVPVAWRQGAAVCVVIASVNYGYGDSYPVPIRGISEAEKVPGVVVFPAGTREIDGMLWGTGGRLLNVTAVGATQSEARERAYEAVVRIQCAGRCRNDIALESG